MPFKYAPPVAVLFAPFALLPRALGAVLWNVGSVVLLLLALARLPRVDEGPRDADASWAALALAGPVGTVLFYGQVDLWLLGLVTLAAAAAATARDGGGVALGLAVLTKPPAVFAGLFFLAPAALAHARRRRLRGPARRSARRRAGRAGALRGRAHRLAQPRRAEHRRVGHRAQPAGPPHPRPRRRRLARDAAQPRHALARPALGRPPLRRGGARAARRRRRRLPDDHPRRRHVLAARLARQLRARPARGAASGEPRPARATASAASCSAGWSWPACSPRACSWTAPRPSGCSPSAPGACSGSCWWSSSSPLPGPGAPVRAGTRPG